ncbi:AAA family ATPase [Agromyces sp. NPDC057679]|uniref:AAA family ATPase n=1 Tax=Agromyces sp. NPDC057679 TaxID=3346207 RepID=UPI0036734597
MQITSIELEGFWSYRDPQQINLEGHPLVVGVGENGAGKSAILVHAVAVAFYGKFPKATIDENISTGAPQGRVSVEFAIDDVRYRVSRVYPRTGSPTGQVLIADPSTRSGWRPVTEKGIREVSAYMQDLLGMPYETAQMTWLAEQGQYGKFASAQPAERFKLLSTIFDLDIYAQKASAASAAARAADAEVTKIDGRIAEVTGTMEQQDTVDHGFTAMSDKQVTQNAADAAEELDRYTQQLAELNSADPARQTVEIRQAYELVRQERVGRLNAALAKKDRSELTSGQTKQRANAQRQQATARLEQDLAAASKRAEEQKTRATNDRRNAGERLLEIVAAERDITAVEQEAAGKREAADQHRRAAADLQAEAGRQIGEYTNLKAEFVKIREELIPDAEARIANLERTADGHADCFTCGQHLSREDAAALIDAQRAQINGWIGEMEDFKARAIAAKDASEQTSVRADQELDAARREDAAAAQIAARVARLAALVASRPQVEQAKADADQLLSRSGRDEEQWRKQVGEAHHAQVKEIDEHEASAVAAAEADLAQAVEEIAETETPSAREAALADDLAVAERAVAAEAAGFQERRQDLEQKRDDAKTRSSSLAAESTRRHHAATARAEQESRLKGLRSSKEEAEQKRNTLQTLHKAFSPAGIPAMILNNVVDELNEAMNVSLERLSRGELRVELRTSRETTKGGSDNKITVYVETPTGVRPYDLLSGGQRFRVDLAIRAGLAAAISRGTGTPIRSFILDEGWGTLDEKGILSTIETLFRLSEDTNVITVSHIASVRDAFPARVEVRMDGGTSAAELAA